MYPCLTTQEREEVILEKQRRAKIIWGTTAVPFRTGEAEEYLLMYSGGPDAIIKCERKIRSDGSSIS